MGHCNWLSNPLSLLLLHKINSHLSKHESIRFEGDNKELLFVTQLSLHSCLSTIPYNNNLSNQACNKSQHTTAILLNTCWTFIETNFCKKTNEYQWAWEIMQQHHISTYTPRHTTKSWHEITTFQAYIMMLLQNQLTWQ